MIRRARNPSLWASSRYASTTGFTSRGGTLCRSNTSVTGMRTGSSSVKHLVRGDDEIEFRQRQARHVAHAVGVVHKQLMSPRIGDIDVRDTPRAVLFAFASPLDERI